MYGMKGNIFEIFLNTVSLSILLAKASFVFLLIAMFSYWFQAAFKYTNTKNKVLSKLPLAAMYSANLTLAFMLSLRWIESGHFPLSNLYESLLFLSWSLTSIHLFLESVVNKGEQIAPLSTLGAITSPLCLFTNAFATFSLPQEMQKVTVLVPALQSNWLIMHVSVMIISYAALLSGSLLAMGFLVSRFVEDTKIRNNLSFDMISFRNATYSVPINPHFLHFRNTFTSFLHTVLSMVQNKTGSVPTYPTNKQSISAYPSVMQDGLQNHPRTFSDTGGMKSVPSSLHTYHTLPHTLTGACEATHTTLHGKGMQEGGKVVSRSGSTPFKAEYEVQIKKGRKAGSGVTTLSYENPYVDAKNKDVKEVLEKKGGFMKTSSKNTNFLIPYCETVLIKQHNASTPISNLVDKPIIEVNKIMKNTFKGNLSQTLDNLSYRSIGLGFALLTIGILSGAVWANEAWGSYWSWDPKETWAFVTWLVFAFYLHTRLSKGWVGKESAFVAIFGFAIIWFCYLGVNFFGKGLHSYGWFHTTG